MRARNGPPRIEVGPREITPEGTDNTTTSTDQSTDTQIIVAASCRCAYGESCVCHYYAGWTCDWNSAQDTVSQLRRRNDAALRMPPNHSGRRDPISARLGRWAA